MFFFAKTDFVANKNEEFQRRIAVSRVGNKRQMVDTSSFAGWIQAVLYGFDMARTLKGLIAALLF